MRNAYPFRSGSSAKGRGNTHHVPSGPHGGEFTSGGGSGGGPAAADKPHGGGPGHTGNSDKPHADKGKFAGQKVGKSEHLYAEKVEKTVARAVKGKQLSDNEPLDVRVTAGGHEHAVEVKSLLKGSKQSISVHDDALLRKVEYARANPGSTFHTVVIDRRNKYGGGQFAEHYSGHTIYYRRGAGRYSLASMHPVRDLAELNGLIHAPAGKLPAGARGDLPKGEKARKLKASAEKAHAARLVKDRTRKQRLRAERQAGG